MTAGMSPGAATALCDRLEELSLVKLAWSGEYRVLILHDVVRDEAATQLGEDRLAATHSALIDAARPLTRLAMPTTTDQAAELVIEAGTGWWRLPRTGHYAYLLRHVAYHLQAAGLEKDLDEASGDMRFIAARLGQSGPAAVEADLARSPSQTAAKLRRAIAQNAHLLGPVTPGAALTTVLTSRLGYLPAVADQLPALRSGLGACTAQPAWPLPDQPSQASIRTLTGHGNWVQAVAIAPDGSWLATASTDRTVRTWSADGTSRATLTGHTDWVNAVAISPDGTWLATASSDTTVRTWSADGTHRATMTGHTGPVKAVAIAPDGTWLATGSNDGTVRIWDADGTPYATLTGHTDWVNAVAIAPDGTRLATGSNDGTVRIWNADGTPYATLTGHTGPVNAVAIAPDGTRLATGSNDKTVRIWNADGTPYATLTGHTRPVSALAISPDGTWLATVTTGTNEWIKSVVRIWAADGTPRATLTGHTDWVNAMAIAPDGTWLATASNDKTVRIWAADGTHRATLTDHTDSVNTVAIAPDGTWLATGSNDGTVRIYQAGSLSPEYTTMIRVDGDVGACAWFPAGSSLCVVGSRGIYRFLLVRPTTTGA